MGGETMVSDASRQEYFAKLNEDFQLELKVSQWQENPTYHIHDEYELLLCLSDDMICRVNGKQYEVGRDTLLLFNNMDLHLFGPKVYGADNRRYVLYFKPGYLESMITGRIDLYACFLFRPFPDCCVLPLDPEQSREMQAQFQKILALERMPEEECYGKDFHIHLMLSELLLTVNRIYLSHHKIPGTSLPSNYQQAYKAIRYIHDNYSDEISLDSLAKDFYINKYNLCKVFREVTGYTPSQYLINWRIAKAKQFLLDGWSVDRACAESGFNNLSHFSRTFKRVVGLSPKQFQQKGKKDFT